MLFVFIQIILNARILYNIHPKCLPVKFNLFSIYKITVIQILYSFLNNILFTRLSSTFGIKDHTLNLLKTYLLNRNQKVKINEHYSSVIPIEFGVPQGSVLGPLIFAMYIYPIGEVINRDVFRYHQYADDTQLYSSCKPSSILNTVDQITSSTSDINDWMTTNKL